MKDLCMKLEKENPSPPQNLCSEEKQQKKEDAGLKNISSSSSVKIATTK